MMKIAWFGHVASERRNGLVSYSRDTVHGLREHDCEVLFFYHAARERAPHDPNGIRIGSLDLMNKLSISSPRAREIIIGALKQWQTDVAHVSIAFSQLDFSLADVCHSLDIPVIATMHFPYGPPDTLWGAAAQLTYRLWANPLAKYDAVIVFSDHQRSLLAEYGVARERIHIIPNGVDVNKWSPGYSSYKEEIGASLLMTYFGRVDPEKNVDVLLECFEKMDLPEDHKLVIIGDGTDLSHLRRKFGHNRRILFRGFIQDIEQNLYVLRTTDIFILPSQVEGLSLSMLEGMAMGCAVIATDVGSDGDALRGAGLVLDLESLEEQLPLAIRTLIEFPDFRRELGERARRRAVTHFSMEQNLNQLLQLYRQEYDHWHRGMI
jgi:glycosyltransferase involved in cell wall biosynthesis